MAAPFQWAFCHLGLWPPSHSRRELELHQFGGRRWEGDRHEAEDGSLEPSRSPCPGGAAPPATGTRLHLINSWLLVFIDCAAQCRHLILARVRGFSVWFRPRQFFLWDIICDFFLSFLPFFTPFPSNFSHLLSFFCHLPSFHYSVSPSCYLLRICGQLRANSPQAVPIASDPILFGNYFVKIV